MSQKITVEAELVGTEQVNAGFRSIAAESQRMTAQMHQVEPATTPINNNLKEMSREMRQTARDVTIMGTAIMGLTHAAEAFGFLNREQAKMLQGLGAIITLSSTMIRVNEVLTRSFAAKTAATITDTAATWAATIAEKARAVALAIMHALTGPYGWAILGGAAVAASAGLALTTQIPERHTGGPVIESGPHNLLAGEWVLSREQVSNISNMGGVTINVYEGSTAKVMDALRRAGIK